MRARLLIFICFFLNSTAGWTETISFKPGQRSATVKGTLVADQTRKYSFTGQAGDRFELQADSSRAQWLVVHVKAADKREIFNNFDSGALKGQGVLPVSGDYVVELALRRPEAQREGRLDYLITLSLHPKAVGTPIKDASGDYAVSDGQQARPIQAVSVALEDNGQAEITVTLEGESFIVKGRWKEQGDEAVTLELSEAFGQKILSGRGVVLFDDEIREDGEPTQVFLRFSSSDLKTHHSLFFGQP